MPNEGESCSNCFFVEVLTKRTLVGRRAQTNTSLSCHYETPSGSPGTSALWPPVDPTDWCGGWSSTGQSVYRTTTPAPARRLSARAVFRPTGTFTPTGEVA